VTTGQPDIQAFRGKVLHCLDDPGLISEDVAVAFFEDGLLVIENGLVHAVGEAPDMLPSLPSGVEIVDYGDKFILPGFIDTHIHYPQTDMIASYGEQLLDWLEKYAFPSERRFSDPQHSADVAEFFLDELVRNGTTTVQAIGTVHPQSVDALFEAAEKRGLRLIAGKVLMDRHCPDDLRDTATLGYQESKALIERWHRHDRLHYAITPRFALTSSDEQLRSVGKLASEYPDVFVHTHLAENRTEVQKVAELFPDSRSYLDVYDRFGLLRERSTFAHSIHIDDADRKRLAETGATMAFCPTANLFLGSGLFDWEAARSQALKIGLGTDVGAGTSFSMLRTLSEAYKVVQLCGQKLSPFEALHLATLGGAKALHLDDKIGNFVPGKEADFIVLDGSTNPLLKRRISVTQDAAETLFAMIMLGDDRTIFATHIMGKAVYRRASKT